MGLITIDKKYTPKPGTEISIKGMPATQQQPSLGICYAYTASVLIDKAYCDEKNIADCGNAPAASKTSPLDLARFSRKLSDDVDFTDRFNYEGIKEGGDVATTLQNALATSTIVKSSCADPSWFLSNKTDPVVAQKEELEVWSSLKSFYKQYREQKKSCGQCAERTAEELSRKIKEMSGFKRDDYVLEDLRAAFKEKSYDIFLDKVLIPDRCWDLKNMTSGSQHTRLRIFPEHPKAADGSVVFLEGDDEVNFTSYDELLAKIKSVLAAGSPLGIGLCLQPEFTAKTRKQCEPYGHSVVISGYRKVCHGQHCKDSLKVINSWGEDWQVSNDNGWLDANNLLDRSLYTPQAIAWLEKEPSE